MKKVQALIRNPVALNGGVMFMGTMVVNVGAYLYHVIVGRIMGPEKYGEFAALFSLLFILSVPANVVQISLTKFFSDIKARGSFGEAKSLFLVTIKYLFLGSILGGVLFIPIIPLLQKLLKINDFMSFIWLFGIVATSFYITSVTGVLSGFQKFFPTSVFQVINIGTRLASGILLAPFGAAITLLGVIVSNIITLVYGLLPIKFILKEKPVQHVLNKKEAYLFAFPTLMTTLGITMIYNLDVVLVKMFFTAEQAGIYASLSIFGKIIFFASSALIIVLFPMVVEKKASHKNYKSLIKVGLLGVGGISFGIATMYLLMSSFIPTLLFGKAYASAGIYLGLYGIFLAFVTTINYLVMMCLAMGKTSIWKILLIGVFVQVAGMFLFHSTLMSLIVANMITSGLIFVSILVYYMHEARS